MFTKSKRGKDTGRDAFYAHMVEWGTVKMAPRSFMRAGFASAKDKALETFKRRLAEKVETAVAEAARR